MSRDADDGGEHTLKSHSKELMRSPRESGEDHCRGYCELRLEMDLFFLVLTSLMKELGGRKKTARGIAPPKTFRIEASSGDPRFKF